MPCIQIEPHITPLEKGWLLGVLSGDGWCTTTVGLRSVDKDFVVEFSRILNCIAPVDAKPIKEVRETGSYWVCRSGARNLVSFIKAIKNQKVDPSSWLRGLFDSEGNVVCSKMKKWNSYHRKIAFYTTDELVRDKCVRFLNKIGIASKLRIVKPSQGHKGTKIVYEIKVMHNHVALSRFSNLVSSTIKRKRVLLDKLPLSYCKDLRKSMVEAQLKGAAVKRKYALTVRLPTVLAMIRERLRTGASVTQRACYSIPEYGGLLRYFNHSELIKKAGVKSK